MGAARAARTGPGLDRPRPRPAPPFGDRPGPLRHRASRRREQPGARQAEPRPRHGHRAPDADARRRWPERDRPGAVPGARHPAHRRAHEPASLRRRRAILLARLRVRLLVQRRGDLREVGQGRNPRRRRQGHPHVPARRDPDAAARSRGRRTAPPGVGASGARGVSRRGQSGTVPRADRRRVAAVAGGQDLPGRGWRRHRGRPGRRDREGCDRRLRPAPRRDLLPVRHALAHRAQVPGQWPGGAPRHRAEARLLGRHRCGLSPGGRGTFGHRRQRRPRPL